MVSAVLRDCLSRSELLSDLLVKLDARSVHRSIRWMEEVELPVSKIAGVEGLLCSEKQTNTQPNFIALDNLSVNLNTWRGTYDTLEIYIHL